MFYFLILTRANTGVGAPRRERMSVESTQEKQRKSLHQC